MCIIISLCFEFFFLSICDTFRYIWNTRKYSRRLQPLELTHCCRGINTLIYDYISDSDFIFPTIIVIITRTWTCGMIWLLYIILWYYTKQFQQTYSYDVS